VVESLRVPARRRPTGGRAERLLPHVLESTGHAQRLRAVPDLAVRLLTTAADELRDAGELDTSRPALERALAIAQAQLGSDHPDTLAARAGLAYILGEAGQPAQAADQYRDLFNDYLRVLGPDHPNTIITHGNLAYMLGEAGQPAQAANLYRDLLNDRLRVLGPDHPDTLTARGMLAYWEDKQKADNG
jgi:tetratricopeptide (TPR) repeat protein